MKYNTLPLPFQRLQRPLCQLAARFRPFTHLGNKRRLSGIVGSHRDIAEVFHMGAVPERKKLISFADVAPRLVAASSDGQGYNQLTFEGVETETQEIEIENLQIIKQPTSRKTETGSVWGCTVAYQKDLWHQEDFGVFVLHASTNAETAQALKLKLNDVL